MSKPSFSSLIAPPALVSRAQSMDTQAIQAMDSAHYIHSFTDHGDLATGVPGS